jgi:hypothetical protein
MNQDPDEEWELRWTRKQKGTHRPGSKATPGVERDLLYENGTNKLLGPTESFPADRSALHRYDDPGDHPPRRELSPFQQAVANALEQVVDKLVWEVVVPHVEEVVIPHVRDVVYPAAKQKVRHGAQRARAWWTKAPDGNAQATPQAPEPSQDLDTATDQSEITMTSAEFRRRLAQALIAEQFAATQKQILLQSRIDDHNVPPELASTIKLALEGGVPQLSEIQQEQLLTFLTEAPANNPLALSRERQPREED